MPSAFLFFTNCLSQTAAWELNHSWRVTHIRTNMKQTTPVYPAKGAQSPDLSRTQCFIVLISFESLKSFLFQRISQHVVFLFIIITFHDILMKQAASSSLFPLCHKDFPSFLLVLLILTNTNIINPEEGPAPNVSVIFAHLATAAQGDSGFFLA